MSDLLFLYFIAFISNIYIGYSESVKKTEEIIGISQGILIGLIIGVICLAIFKVTSFIWAFAKKNQKKSIGAIIGVSYSLFCISVMIFCCVATGNLTEYLIS